MLEKISSYLNLILVGFTILFAVCGFIEFLQDENATVYFLLALCFSLIVGGKQIYDKKS